MSRPLDPQGIFGVLARLRVDYVLVGGLAAVLHGAPTLSDVADIVPSRDDANLDRLGQALTKLKAKLRAPDDPEGIAFNPHPALLASMNELRTTTRYGDLNVGLRAGGPDDYRALERVAQGFDIDGVAVRVASLADVIRSKETAGAPEDVATLPILRALEAELRGRGRL